MEARARPIATRNEVIVEFRADLKNHSSAWQRHQPASDKSREEIMGLPAMRQELADPILDPPRDQTEYCVSRLAAIAQAEEPLEQKLRDAETQISDLLLANASGWFIILQLLIERLRSELNRHDGATRTFLANLIEFIERHLERTRTA